MFYNEVHQDSDVEDWLPMNNIAPEATDTVLSAAADALLSLGVGRRLLFDGQ